MRAPRSGRSTIALGGCFAALLLAAACGDDGGATTLATTSTAPTSTTPAGEGLLLPATSDAPPPTDPWIARSRDVRFDEAALFDAGGNPVGAPARITLNLFDDLTYTGIVEDAEGDAGVYTWNGRLDGIEHGYFYIVYTSDVYMVHAASPLGIYEVSYLKDDIYRVVEIDQTQLPGGEG